MCSYRFGHLGDGALARELATRASSDRVQLAELLACLAEFDARRLYRPAGYPSMFAYCVGALGMTDDVVGKRIYVARKARRFPAILPALAEGRLSLTAIVMMGNLLTEATAPELLRAAENRTKSEVAELLARRFPQPDVPTRIEPLSGPVALENPVPLPPIAQHVPEHVEFPRKFADAVPTPAEPVAPDPAGSTQASAMAPEARPSVRPLAAERYALQVTIAQDTHDKLRRFQDLLGHQVPMSDLAQVLDRALDIAIQQLERRKFAATSRPRRGRRPAHAPRTIPAAVKRAVRERDGGRCTFVADSGHRCEARRDLEFDHVLEVARGGDASVANIRLRCRAHNQYTAECTFGAGFMREKRERAG
jgi:hypothetical protein